MSCSNVLLVEDNPGDARLISQMFEEVDGEQFRLWQVDRLSAGLDYLSKRDVGVILLDLSLPDSLGIETFSTVFAKAPQVPIIVLTGTDDEVLALNAVKTGAQDYLIKGKVDSGLLMRAVRYAMERKEAERALRESEERYALAATGANDGLWDWNLKEGRIYYSPRWKAMLGYREDEIGSTPEEWTSRVHPDDLPQLRQDLERHMHAGSPFFEIEYRILHKDGGYRWMLCRGMAVRDGEQPAQRMAGSQTDIHERKLATQQLLHDALHDALTGLPNRTLLLDRMKQALERTTRYPDRMFAVLFIDLDRFKNVNDSLGHIAGDDLLKQCAKRLASNCRPADTLARLGGDEFILLLDGISEDADAIRVAERIQTQFREPFHISGQEVYMAASIGVAFNTPSSNDPEELLRDADTAMYRAKAQGKACYSVFDSTMHAEAVAVLQMESNLRRAIDRASFHLEYQPIVALASGTIAGFEALLRWDREGSAVLPADFIPLAEETGLIVPIGNWVLQEACRQMRRWLDAAPENRELMISVNVSSRQFAQDGLIEQIAYILQQTGIAPHNLKLEMTESVIMGNADVAAIKLQQLRDLGVRISMDDFGTGYSSLSYLQRFPIDTLKIDQSFVARMEQGGQSVEIVRAVLSLASAFGMDVIAEGTENAAQLEALNALGCDYGQGYYFSRPLRAEGAGALLRERRQWSWSAAGAAEQVV